MNYKDRIYLVKSELGAPLNSRFSLYKGDILFCNSIEDEMVLKEFLYGFNGKQYLMTLKDSLQVPSWKRVTSLFNGNSLTPMKILVRDGLLEDITRDYKLKIILGQ